MVTLASRSEIAAIVPTLTADQLTHTGTHDHFGTLTIQRVLEIALEHDGEHETDLLAIVPQANSAS
jgi:hypothetical protein